mgnify:FL=1
MEVADVTQFLAQITPFNQLSNAVLAPLSAHIKVCYCQAQEKVSVQTERLMIIRTGIFSLYSDQQQLLTKLQPGDFYGYQQLLTGLTDNDTLVCDENKLYRYTHPANRGRN